MKKIITVFAAIAALGVLVSIPVSAHWGGGQHHRYVQENYSRTCTYCGAEVTNGYCGNCGQECYDHNYSYGHGRHCAR